MISGILENLAWKESSVPPDSSSSETGKDTPPEVQFVVGDDDVMPPLPLPVAPKSTAKDKIMTRSFSQEATSMTYPDLDNKSALFLSKTSLSDNALDLGERKARKYVKELSTVQSVDDETLSTDSNSTADNDELKKRRRKLHFPGFKKTKGKLT
uniref:Uncharacterized protein n=1 Tax=Bracon brevicornis TaxID=1563983 RepID=A0A6V7ICA2_9HYME